MRKIILNDTREDLAKLFHGKGAEIGVEQGRYSEVICKTNPGVRLYCVDPWTPYSAYVDHRNTSKLERFYRRTRKLLAPYGAKIVRKSSMEALKDFPNHSLDFVYIDANHAYSYVMEDIVGWSKKVKPGGWVAGHDYIAMLEHRPGFFDVVRAVDEFTKDLEGELIVYTGDQFPSWAFQKK